MRKVDPLKQQARREAILDAAAMCFSRGGFHGTSTNDVCAAAGMSPGNLFHYFANKKALVLAVVERQGHELQALLEELETVSEPAFALSMLFDALFAVAADADSRCLVVEIAAEAARDADVQALARAGDEVLHAGLLHLLQASARAGAAAPLEPQRAAGLLMMVVDGLFSRVASDPGFDAVRERATLQQVLEGMLLPAARA